jgi:hypothetical protein
MQFQPRSHCASNSPAALKTPMFPSRASWRNSPRVLLLILLAALSCRNADHPSPLHSRDDFLDSRPATPALPSQIWRSETTHNEYRVHIEKAVFHAEWVNVPEDQAGKGAYLHTRCVRRDGKWVGVSRSKLPCTVRANGSERIVNWCELETRIEIDSISPHRITGHAQSLKKVDCGACKILESDWGGFVWIPRL